MAHLNELSQSIVEQSAQFKKFISQLADIEINEKPHLDILFEKAGEKMPLYKEQIENLRANLALLDSATKPSLRWLYKKAS